MKLLAVISSLLLVATQATDYATPGPTFEAKDYTKWTKLEGKSRRGEISVNFQATDGSADYVNLFRLDLVGTAYERGYAHGKLMHREIVEFAGPQLDKYFASMVMSIDLSNFPEPMQSVLKVLQLKGAKAAPELFHTAMAWVWEQEKKYVPQYYFDEINGMADGICAGLKTPNCNTTMFQEAIQNLNMLPELIRMACTAYGAWGKASDKGQLIQLRALDFGGGPFANYTVISTHRGDPDNDQAYVTVSFPAFVGVITGVSQSGIGVSEKVWMVYDTPTGLLPGKYDGEPDVFVLRDILAYKKTRADAEAYLNSITRTFAIWIGIGDYKSQQLDLVQYRRPNVTVLTDVTAPAQTGGPYIENIAYVDKHPQPSTDTSLPTALTDFYGNISCETSKTIIQYHHTGDVHIASYDFTNDMMYVAIGRINGQGEYGPEGASDMDQWKAYNRPYFKFNLNDLWQGI